MIDTVVVAGEDTLHTCLDALDALLHREILRLRARYQLSLDEFRGLYISDEQVEELVHELRGGSQEFEPSGAALRTETLRAVVRHDRLRELAVRFELSAKELLLLFMAVAPGLHPKYQTLYAYLNNDITRKALSVDLAVQLASGDAEEALQVRAAFAPGSLLTTSGLVQSPFARDAAAGYGLAVAHAGLANFLLGLPFQDERIVDIVQTRSPTRAHVVVAGCPEFRALAARAERALDATAHRLVWLDHSPSLSARACALAFCAIWGLELAILDVRRLAHEAIQESIWRAALLAQISDAGLLIEGLESLCSESRWVSEAYALRALLGVKRIPVLLAAPGHCSASLLFASTEYVPIIVSSLPVPIRRTLWESALTGRGLEASSAELEELARRFHLGPEPVEAAALRLFDEAHLNGCNQVDRSQLFAAARAQADTGLDMVAQRVSQRHTWEDLVLPSVTRERVRGLINALRSRERVLEEWGMGRAIGTVGLRALFAGPSGTGKTMTASVIARELGVDVYRIDLSTTVSKYIGETEKNLERIFRAAERAGAILFFDEADALLGKRAEAKDAHDRYANIEVAYLLQRLEEFDGVVIVATNISRNIDAAFARRMQFVIEFPLPGAGERERLWRSSFPPQVPMATDVDFEFVSRRFELTGGDIRNMALDAAFLAASQNQPIGMRHVVQALARELTKQGRSPSATEFKQHYVLLDAVDCENPSQAATQ